MYNLYLARCWAGCASVALERRSVTWVLLGRVAYSGVRSALISRRIVPIQRCLPDLQARIEGDSCVNEFLRAFV